MHEQPQNIRDEKLFRFASAKRYLKIFVPDFAFKHDDNNVGKDKFVGREIQLRKLYTWLTSDSKSGSYLITGYRGMGKSLLVKRVIDMITREPKNYKEVLFQVAMALTILACYFGAETVLK
jgi:Cdc6-like AAA superfamily ATPase